MFDIYTISKIIYVYCDIILPINMILIMYFHKQCFTKKTNINFLLKCVYNVLYYCGYYNKYTIKKWKYMNRVFYYGIDYRYNIRVLELWKLQFIIITFLHNW